MIKSPLLILALAIMPVMASAHAKTGATVPADGETVRIVPELSMQFDDPIRIISVTLKSAEGHVDIVRETGMDPLTMFRATPAQDLAPGSYQFEWRGMAADGHPMQGSFSFTVAK